MIEIEFQRHLSHSGECWPVASSLVPSDEVLCTGTIGEPMKRVTQRTPLTRGRIVAMAVLVLAVVVLSTLNIRLAWQKYQEPKLFTISEERVAEVVETQPEFVEWIANDISDEDGGILNLKDTGRAAKVR